MTDVTAPAWWPGQPRSHPLRTGLAWRTQADPGPIVMSDNAFPMRGLLLLSCRGGAGYRPAPSPRGRALPSATRPIRGSSSANASTADPWWHALPPLRRVPPGRPAGPGLARQDDHRRAALAVHRL